MKNRRILFNVAIKFVNGVRLFVNGFNIYKDSTKFRSKLSVLTAK